MQNILCINKQINYTNYNLRIQSIETTEGGRTNQKQARRGKREKIFETIHVYVEKIFAKFNKVLRRFSFVRNQKWQIN